MFLFSFPLDRLLGKSLSFLLWVYRNFKHNVSGQVSHFRWVPHPRLYASVSPFSYAPSLSGQSWCVVWPKFRSLAVMQPRFSRFSFSATGPAGFNPNNQKRREAMAASTVVPHPLSPNLKSFLICVFSQ